MKKKKIANSFPLHSRLNISQPPSPWGSPINCNNNTMDMAFLVQMRQSNICGSVRNSIIINLHFGLGALKSASPASWKTPAIFIDSIRSNNQPGKTKECRNEMQLPTNCVVMPWPICTEPRGKTGRLGTQL